MPKGMHLPRTEAEHLRRSRVVNNLRRTNDPPSHTGPNYAVRSKKIFSTFLVEFYEANPDRRKKLMMKAIEYAEKGNARFMELIITLVEGPLKDKDTTNNTVNFNFMSDGDRERALSSVRRIMAMDAASPQKQLPEASDDGGSDERSGEQSGGVHSDKLVEADS